MMKTEELNLKQEWDKVFPKSEKVSHRKVTFVNHFGITLAADMYIPETKEEKLPAIDMVRKATLNKIGKFNKQDIRELCPSLSVSSIEGALRKMVSSGELKREGSGKSTFYYHLK